MQGKTFEVRDRGTFIPVVAMQLTTTNTDDFYIMRRAGFVPKNNLIVLTKLSSLESQHSPYSWTGGRTLQVVHNYLMDHWEETVSGQVLDVEFILREVDVPKVSEQHA
jgi:hypothetical protein